MEAARGVQAGRHRGDRTDAAPRHRRWRRGSAGRAAARGLRLRGLGQLPPGRLQQHRRGLLQRRARRVRRGRRRRRYVNARTIASGSTLHELDVHNLSPCREPTCRRSSESTQCGKFVPELVWRSTRGRSSAPSCRRCSPATARRRCCPATRSRSRTRHTASSSPATSSCCCSSSGSSRGLPLRQGRVQGRHQQPPRRPPVRRARRLPRREAAQARTRPGSLPAASRALSRDSVPHVAEFIRADGGSYVDRPRVAAPPQRRPDRALGAGRHRDPRPDRLRARSGRSSSRSSTATSTTPRSHPSDAGVQRVYSLRVDTTTTRS